MIRHTPLIAVIGSGVYAVYLIGSMVSEMKSQIKSLNEMTIEKFKTTDEKINSLRNETILKSLENTLKYHKSSEYESLQSPNEDFKKNEKKSLGND